MDEIRKAMFTTAHQLAEQFPHALQRMERRRDVGELTGFFSQNAVLSKTRAGPDQ